MRGHLWPGAKHPMGEETMVAALKAADFPTTLKKVQANVMEGKFGERGEEYVATQAFLLLCIVIGTVPLVGGSLFFLAGPVCVALGGALLAAGVYELQGDLTPWTVPPAEAQLKTGGVYEYVRHPLYGGLLLLCFGLAIVSNSASRLVLTLALYFVLDKKADNEEEVLQKKFSSYGGYASKTKGKLLPDLDKLLASGGSKTPPIVDV
ncbi:unnamed protein product [Effrenium voratum]|uniref:Steroid 5-alpha reductase C-terminal domain-containing protein n=1 Tax=Effrenium voratum TaxID=2562239 RepID=A0AA36N3T7_9DINO|nr:unnamed protein product [Effrenium voratum]